MIQTHSKFVVYSLWFEVRDLKFLHIGEPFSGIELQMLNGASQGTIIKELLLVTTN